MGEGDPRAAVQPGGQHLGRCVLPAGQAAQWLRRCCGWKWFTQRPSSCRGREAVGDRIELYRPLLVDPKEARKQRADKAKRFYRKERR
ncbi:RnfH family protein [Pseudomonas japonica]|uniref:RnfH family protein n=1 Tax=Pseudomonas japonica TaxID=256466 RepID=UPI000A020EF7